MAQIAGLSDLRGAGPPGDTGTFQMPCSVLVFQFTFSGTTYCAAIRAGDRGWIEIAKGTVAATVINAALVYSGELYFASANYSITASLNIINIDNLTISCAGGANLTLVGAIACFVINNSDWCKINGLRITGTKAGGGNRSGVYITNSDYTQLSNLKIYNANQDAIFMDSANTGLMVINCYISDPFQHGIAVWNAVGPNNLLFYGNKIDGADTSGIVVFNASNVIISNCISQNCGADGFDCNSSTRVIIAYCHSYNNSLTAVANGIYIGTEGASDLEDVVIIGCTIQSIGSGGTGGFGISCLVTGHVIRRVLIANCEFLANRLCAIHFEGCINSIISGCKIETSPTTYVASYDGAINFYGASQYNTVVACSIMNTGQNTSNYAIYTSAGSGYNVFGNLYLYNNKRGIRLLSNNNVLSGNTLVSNGDYNLLIDGGGGEGANNSVLSNTFDTCTNTNILVLGGADDNVIMGNLIARGATYGVNININTDDRTVVLGNRFIGNGTPINDAGTGTILPTVRASFIKELGTAAWIVTAAAPMGIDIDAANEGALAGRIKLPSDLQQVVRIKVCGTAQVAEADGMRLDLEAMSGIDNESGATGEVISVTKTSSTLNFANLDEVTWVFTAADDADIGHLAADDRLQICCYYAIAAGADCATDVLLSGEEVEISYV